MSWTDERIEQLKSLWEQGMTASQIAEALGGVSRNAVIGKAHRLDLQARPSPVRGGESGGEVRTKPAPPPPVAPATVEVPPAPQPAAVAAKAAPVAASLPTGPVAPAGPAAPPRRMIPAKPSAEIRGKTSLLDLTDKICRWPLGHPGEADFHFCGEPVHLSFPYCRSHCALAYQVQQPRRDRRPQFGGQRAR